MKVFIDAIGSFHGYNIASQIDKKHTLSGSLYPQGGDSALSAARQPSVPEDRLVSAISNERAEQLVAEADVIVVPALESLASAMEILKLVTQTQYAGTKTFICVSTVMTWAKSKSSGKPFQESSFKNRKSSVKFQDLKNFENIVLSCNSSKLHTVVVGAGVTYGAGESVLETFFRDAWLFPEEMLGVPVVGTSEGNNIVPMVHVVDLARLVAALVQPTYDYSDKQGLYVLSVDDARLRLVDIVAAISTAVGCGKLRNLVDFEIQDLMIENPHVTSSLQANLSFDTSNTYANGLGLEWHCRTGLVANISTIAQEFIASRELVAPRVSVLGPPGLGIDALGSWLSSYYQVPLLTKQSLEAEMLALGESGDCEDPVVIAVVEYVAAAKKSKKAPKPMATEQVVNMFKWKLQRAECRNKGWVLVGFPTTAEEAELLCTNGKEEVSSGGDEVQVTYNVDEFNAPQKLVVLDASDADLEQRVTALSDEDLAARFGDVQSFHKALALYRSTHSADGSSNDDEAQHFLQAHCDIDALLLRMEEAEVDDDAGTSGGAGSAKGGARGAEAQRPQPESETSDRVIDTCKLYIENGRGKPFNYRPTRQERQEIARRELEQAQVDQEAQQLAADEARRAETLAREQEELELEQRRNKFIRKEMQMLEKRAMPLREYLMESVVPVLTEGLLEVCKTKPEDPVDYLAEWLFRYDPEQGEKSVQEQPNAGGSQAEQ
eukprot:INCI5261.1.p1 GENE.INCI5261.1~~INCI5261.1.p1  ORF type:complete len:720 (+),score=150.04 INCI5261.1:101-2260(+)